MVRQSLPAGVLISNPVDRQLLVQTLVSLKRQALTLSVEDDRIVGIEDDRRLCIIVVDSCSARMVWPQLVALKDRAAPFVLPLLVIHFGPTVAEDWVEEGADDVLMVPFTRRELKARLRSYLRLHDKSREMARYNRDMYEAFLSQLQDGVAIANARGDIVAWNQAMEQISGIKASQAMGQPLWEMHAVMKLPGFESPEHQEELRQQILHYLRTGEATHRGEIGSAVFQRGDGAIVAIERLHFPIEVMPRERWLVCLIRDVSHRQRIETDLQAYTERLEHLHMVTSTVNSTLDFEEVVYFVLRELRAVVGYESAGLFLREGRRFRLAAIYGINPPHPYLGEIVPDNLLLTTICDSGQPLILADVLQDERWEFWTENVQTRGWMGLPLLAGHDLLGIISLESAEVDAFQPVDARHLQPYLTQIAQAVLNARLHQQEVAHARELEQRVIERTRELNQRTEEAEALNDKLAAVVEQLSESNWRYQQTADELQRLNEELRAFSYSVSHDLKAPLRAVSGYAHLLARNYSERLGEEGLSFLANIQSGVRHMAQLIDDLLDYSQLEHRSLRRETVDVTDFVSSLVEERSRDIAVGQVDLQLALESAILHIDVEALAIILRNLLDNALKFTQHEVQPRVHISGQAADGSYTFTIADNGIGFDMSYHDQIFGVFQRLHVDEEYSGTGIGLAMVRKAATRLGGRVWAQSQEGQGATFFVEVPQ